MQRTGFFSQPMRRLLLAALVWMGAAVPGVALAQLACNTAAEGFETGAFPAGWSSTTLALPAGQWLVSTDNSSSFWNPGPAPEGTYYASANDDAGGSGSNGSADYLYTNIIDLSGASVAALNFQYHFNGSYGQVAGGVQVSPDGGGTWDPQVIVPTGSAWQTYSYDLSAYAGNSNVQVRFHSDDGGAWASGYAIDDVSLDCIIGVAPAIGVTPASLAASQAANLTTTQTLNIANTGGNTLNWDIDEENLFAPGPILPTQASSQHNSPGTASKHTTQQVTIGDNTLAAAGTGVGQSVIPSRPATPEALVTITQSTSQTITSLNSASCNAGGLHTDNSYMRVFDLAAFGIASGMAVTNVEFGIEQAVGAAGSQPVTVNLYVKTNPAAPLTFANLTAIGTAPVVVSDQSLTILSVPVLGMAGPGDVLVVEVFTPEGQTDGHTFFIGSNALGQTAPSYIAAADCGITEPTDTAAIGFPGMHIVMNVTGDADVTAPVCTVLSDIPWLSLDITSGANAGGTDTDVTTTFDSTGYAAGTYTGNLCVTSDAPATPLVVVPVSMTVTAAAPNVNVGVGSLAATLAQNATTSQTLAIGNTGTAALTWTMDEEPGSGTCASPASVAWLSFTPASGTTAAAGSDNVTVGFDATGLAAGTYNASLCLSSDDPDAGPGNGTNLVVIPVALTVTAVAAPPPRLVPTFGPVGGTLLGLLLAGFGLVLLRRYQR